MDVGYRHIDTAAIYENEAGVGRAIANSKLNRDELFITTKLWVEEQTKKDVHKAFELSLKKLNIDYIDLYLIHWPSKGLIEQWQALEELYLAGKIKAIGVSNFHTHHFETLFPHAKIKPMVNQIELHPQLSQVELRLFHKQHNIVTEAWSPLMKGKFDALPSTSKIASKYQKTIPQIMLRWHLQNEVVAIPKTVTPKRMHENFDILDFQLSKAEMQVIDSLNKDLRISSNPDTFASEKYGL